MDNPDTLAQLCAHDTGRRQTKQIIQHRKLKKPGGANPGACKGKGVPASDKTPTVLLIYTFKPSKSIGSDREKKNYIN